MLRDIVEALRHPAPWYLAPMGYFRELSGIAGRAVECREEWQPHLARTRCAIERAVGSCSRRGTVAVAGSGLLLDVPLDTLSEAFGRVVLMDIHHGASVRRAVRARANVELARVDITGAVRDFYRFARSGGRGALPRSRPPVAAPPFDLVISVNLLSQLAVIPRNYILGHCPAFPPARLDELTRDIVCRHLEWLAASGHKACLVSDVERRETGVDGGTVVKDLLGGFVLPEADETWTWTIAPAGKVFRDLEAVHRVAAWPDFRWTPAAPSGSR